MLLVCVKKVFLQSSSVIFKRDSIMASKLDKSVHFLGFICGVTIKLTHPPLPDPYT